MAGKGTKGVVLIGHGGVPKDFPKDKLKRLVELDRKRMAMGGPPSDEERQLDSQIRSWPRNAESDPYKVGLEKLGTALKAELGETRLVLAYNEFCGPTIEEAVDGFVADGVNDVVLISSMMTPGGSHSDREIPEELIVLKERHPNTCIRYAWPYDMNRVARLLKEHVDSFDDS